MCRIGAENEREQMKKKNQEIKNTIENEIKKNQTQRRKKENQQRNRKKIDTGRKNLISRQQRKL